LACYAEAPSQRQLADKIAPIGGFARLHQGPLSRQVIALAATGQLDMAAAGQIRLAAVTAVPRRPGQAPSREWSHDALARQEITRL
jgi:hypothetical protein